MNIAYDEYKQKLAAKKPELEELSAALGLEETRKELAALEQEAEQPGFWDDLARSQKNQQRTKQLRAKCNKYDRLYTKATTTT